MGIEELRVRYEHDGNCSKTAFHPPNPNGLKQCVECAGIFDAAGKGVWVTDKRFDELYNPPVVEEPPEEPEEPEENPNPSFTASPVVLTATVAGDLDTWNWAEYIVDPMTFWEEVPFTFEWENLPGPNVVGETNHFPVALAIFEANGTNWLVQHSLVWEGEPGYTTNMVYKLDDPMLDAFGETIQDIAEYVSGHHTLPLIPFPIIDVGDVWVLNSMPDGYDEVFFAHNAVTVVNDA